jgi:hypothetical protein
MKNIPLLLCSIAWSGQLKEVSLIQRVLGGLQLGPFNEQMPEIPSWSSRNCARQKLLAARTLAGGNKWALKEIWAHGSLIPAWRMQHCESQFTFYKVGVYLKRCQLINTTIWKHISEHVWLENNVTDIYRNSNFSFFSYKMIVCGTNVPSKKECSNLIAFVKKK